MPTPPDAKPALRHALRHVLVWCAPSVLKRLASGGVGTQNRAIFRTSALMYIAMRMARVSLVFVPTGNAGSTPEHTMQQTERLLVLYKQEGSAGILHGSTLWPGADDHNLTK